MTNGRVIRLDDVPFEPSFIYALTYGEDPTKIRQPGEN